MIFNRRLVRLRNGLKILFPCFALALVINTQVLAQAIDEVVLVVDDQAVTAREFSVLHVIHDSTKPYKLLRPEIGDSVTDAIVDELLLAVHAKRLANDVEVSEAQIDAAINALASQNRLSADQLMLQLETQGVDVQIFRDSMRQRLIVQQVVGQRVARTVNVSATEIQDYISNRPELREQSQKKYRASHLVITTPEDISKRARKALRKKALEIQARLEKGASFAEIIASDEGVLSGSDSGDLGWKQQSELPSLFVGALQVMEPGDISPLIDSENGFHILGLQGLESASATSKEYRVRHILKTLASGQDIAEIAAQLINLKQQALAGVEFNALARRESDDPTVDANGGDLGWIKPQQLDPSFAQVMQSLEVGEISDPIRTSYGIHIIQMQQIRDQSGALNLESRVQQQIFSEKVDEKMQDLLNDLKQVALIEVVS